MKDTERKSEIIGVRVGIGTLSIVGFFYDIIANRETTPLSFALFTIFLLMVAISERNFPWLYKAKQNKDGTDHYLVLLLFFSLLWWWMIFAIA